MATGQYHPLSKSDCDMNFLNYWGILVAWSCLVEWKQLLWGVGRVNVVHLPKVCSECQINCWKRSWYDFPSRWRSQVGQGGMDATYASRCSLVYSYSNRYSHKFISRRRYHVGIRYWVERKQQLWAVQALRRQDRCFSSPQIVQNEGSMTFPSWLGIQGQCFWVGWKQLFLSCCSK